MPRLHADRKTLTLKALDEAGLDVRAWCYRCARAGHVDAIIWQLFAERGWPMDMASAAPRFRCEECDRSDQVLLVPATRPKRPSWTGADAVAAFFHGMRSAAKKARREARIRRGP